ncbi:aspartate carbamoyltransferase regulatory subunit [Candidatus Woesearchaeota archaeon]|nr:aspartate carbamoyltransferase regulatory subunit [Candidatus Woesearchaeota archaeon]
MRPYKVYAIQEGTVIDHIPAKRAVRILEALGIGEEDESIVTVGMNFQSRDIGRKDVVKVENRELTDDELNRLALIAPQATINIIKGYKVAKKFKVKLPQTIDGMVRCTNPNCITRVQKIPSRFHLACRSPLRIRCHHCEKVIDRDYIQVEH